jgi:hypothetical protein
VGVQKTKAVVRRPVVRRPVVPSEVRERVKRQTARAAGTRERV